MSQPKTNIGWVKVFTTDVCVTCKGSLVETTSYGRVSTSRKCTTCEGTGYATAVVTTAELKDALK